MIKEKQKLLIVVDWFAPGYKAGGPIKSTVNIALALKDHYNIKVLTTDTDHGDNEPYPGLEPNKWINTIDEKIAVYYAKKSTLSIKQLRQVIIEADADYIYLNHIWSPYFVLYPLWLKYKRILKGKLIVCPRGGLYDSALKVKSYKKWPLLYLMRWLGIQKHIDFHATNDREKMAIEKFFPGSRVLVADNLPSVVQPNFINTEKKVGELRCIFIARIVAIKNLLFLIEVLSKVSFKVSLTIVGPAEEEEYWMLCQKKISVLPANVQVNYMGPRSNNELISLLQSHHLFVLPTTGENFGHSIFEAFLAGRPVLISDQTPWLGLEEKEIGWDINLNKKDDYVKKIEQAATWSQIEFEEKALLAWHYAHAFLENSSVKQQYFKLFF